MHLSILISQRRADEVAEERMRAVGAALELRVVLHADEPGMLRQLDDLHQIAVGVDAADAHAGLDKLAAIQVVELVAMAMALEDILRAIGRKGL